MVTSLSSPVYAGAPTSTLVGLGHDGSDGPSTFFTIDSSTGAATAVGPTGFERCSGMDIDDAGTIFASCERTDGSDAPVLITINPSDGSGTEVGLTGAAFDIIADLSFRPSDGTLFGFDATASDHRLRIINTGSGLGSDVGSTGLGSDGGNGMTFVGDILYHIARDDGLHTLDQSLGTASAGTVLAYDEGCNKVKAMDTDVENGIIWAIITCGFGPTSLGIVNVDSETVTEVGPNNTDDPLDAIAVVPATPTTGKVFYTLFDQSTPFNVKSVDFSYNSGTNTLTLTNEVDIAHTPDADGIVVNPQDPDLLIIGTTLNNTPLDGTDDNLATVVIADGTVTPFSSPIPTFHLELADATTIYAAGIPGGLVSHTINADGSLSEGTQDFPTEGSDDTLITQLIAINSGPDAGKFYYTSSTAGGIGNYGELTFGASFTTSRIHADLTGAHGGEYDPFSDSVIIVGSSHIIQLDPSDGSILCDLEGGVDFAVPEGFVHFDQVVADGKGHLLMTDNGGDLFFVDYPSGDLCGETTQVASSFLDATLDDLAPFIAPPTFIPKSGNGGGTLYPDPNLGDPKHGEGHDNGFCMNQNCIDVDGLFNHFPETTVPSGSTQTFTLLIQCQRGSNLCNHISLAGVLPDSDFFDDQWSATVDRQPRSENWDLTVNNPFGEIGEVTVTVQTLSQSFITATFNIQFLIPGSIGTADGIGDPQENNRHLHVTIWDSNGGSSNYVFNEGMYVDDIYAYPQVKTPYDEPLEYEALCLNENPNKRYTCAFDKVREWTLKQAEEKLKQMYDEKGINMDSYDESERY